MQNLDFVNISNNNFEFINYNFATKYPNCQVSDIRDKELTTLTHAHVLSKVIKVDNFKCRGYYLYDDIISCETNTKQYSKYMYECNICKAIKKEVIYCMVCAKREDLEFHTNGHTHILTLQPFDRANRFDEGCDGRYFTHGCQNDNILKETKKFRCSPCNEDHCEACLIYYKYRTDIVNI